MDDLISRQAMLDGIDKLIKIHFDRTVVLYKARKVAEDLPSAQPETNCSEIPNNSDTISRRKAIYVASGYCHPANIATELAKLPAVQPERKTGRWIPSDSELEIKCNKCGKSFSDYVNAGTGYIFLEEIPNFCPNCGAKMEDERKE